MNIQSLLSSKYHKRDKIINFANDKPKGKTKTFSLQHECRKYVVGADKAYACNNIKTEELG